MRATTILLAAVLLLVGSGRDVRAARPNVLLICVDDLKPLLGCYGDTRIRSPRIDQLASQGVRFERAYCNQAVCAPSRNSLLTGLRPSTLGVYDLGTNFRVGAPDAITLPQHFRASGYRVEGLGKIFHVGHGNRDDERSWSVPHWPVPVIAYATAESRAPTGLTREEALFNNVPGDRAQGLPRGAPVESADVPDDAYPDGQLADEAIRRLRSAAERPDEPFFLAVGFVKPHLPFCAPRRYWELYDRESFTLPELRTPPKGAPPFAPTTWGELRQYRDMPQMGPLNDDQARLLIHGYHAAVSYLDAQVGRVLDALQESGLRERTIVVLWGDHGWHLGDHGMWCKHSNYEQAARIPLIIAAPGAASTGAVAQGLAESVDVLPTLCELAGLAPPSGLGGRPLDGVSLAPALRDPDRRIKEAVLHVYPRGPRIGRALRTERYRLVEWKPPRAPAADAVVELYDYQEDPQETRNLAGERPETVAALRQLLEHYPDARPPVKP